MVTTGLFFYNEIMNKNTVILQPCPDYSPETIRQALEAVLDKADWIVPGMKIGLKVNLLSGSEPEKSVTTHPSFVEELTRILVERGAQVTIGDSPGGTFTKSHLDKVYEKTQMTNAVRAGAKLNDNFEETQTSFMEAYTMKTFSYTSWLDEVDAIINCSKMKTHAMMTMTGAVKNMFGTIPGTTKPKYHMRYPNHMEFAHMLVDINEYFKPQLCIQDAVEAMEGNGPNTGTTRYVGCLLASTSPYALDMVEATIMGLKREDVPTLEAAYQRGLGPKDISEVIVEGDLDAYIVSDYKQVTQPMDITFGNQTFFGKLVSKLGKTALQSRPEVHVQECIGCSKCKQVCPAEAITMQNNLPTIDRDKCIRCFCCQEFCPVGAMKSHQSLVSKFLNQIEK